MTTPTRDAIEAELLAGKPVKWEESNHKWTELVLDAAPTRRLLTFLLQSPVREAKDLPPAFIGGLWEAYSADDDPATKAAAQPKDATGPRRTWRVKQLETTNFGGVNTWKGPEFTWSLDGDSWLLDGQNGSGKSSLLGAMVWAFTGHRPRDQAATPAHVGAPVVDSNELKLGDWPPLAAYPTKRGDLLSSPEVEVKVTLVNEAGQTAVVERALRTGKVHYRRDPSIDIDEVFVSTGIAMPAALASLRIRDGDGALTKAVQQLTGLDALTVVGELSAGLVHGSREYASFAKKQGLEGKLSSFNQYVVDAQAELKKVGQTIGPFRPSDTLGKDGQMVSIGMRVRRSANDLAGTLAADLASNIDTADPQGQKAILVAIAAAQAKLEEGLDGFASWKDVKELAAALAGTEAERVEKAASAAEASVAEALQMHAKDLSDKRYRLKAHAAAWHAQHEGGDVEHCPLCVHGLETNPELRAELNALRSAGVAAQRTLADNLLAIEADFLAALPKAVASCVRAANPRDPRESLCEDFKRDLGVASKVGNVLAKFAALASLRVDAAPMQGLSVEERPVRTFESSQHEKLVETVHTVRWCLRLASWFEEVRSSWDAWWQESTAPDGQPIVEGETESLAQHLARLSRAMESAKPFSVAADLLKEAVRVGREICAIDDEQARRDKVVDALQPLKQLVALSQGIARGAIKRLSGRIKAILDNMHVAEQFVYHGAALQKREGLIVRGSFGGDINLDATLIANTSWLRSTLWAFIFALREEASEQHGGDPFPVWLFDDPQATFDASHRLNWAMYVAGLQAAATRAQVIIATYDEVFANKLRQADVKAREALVAPATVHSGALALLEGSRVERLWDEAHADRSAAKAVAFLQEARVYLEGMLKAMLAGEGSDVSGFAISALRSRMLELAGQRRAPWDKQSFNALATVLGKPAVNYIQEATHTTRSALTYAEAKRVNGLWPELSRHLTRCFHDIRDWRLLHGAGGAFHLAESTATFPDGYASVIAAKSFPLLGRASAFSGKVSEGSLQYEQFDHAASRGARLAQHSVYRLMASTLEPVARPGDILIVHDASEPQPPSLVVAIAEEKLFARRFVLSETSSDVAVLTANALDPYQIAAPIVANRATLKLKRVVGVIFDRGANYAPSLDAELVACASENAIQGLLQRCSGLVEVNGQSAQPLALDGQFLMVGGQARSAQDLAHLDGQPVIALDSRDRRYFKRLRLMADGMVILESLDGAGDYPPELAWMPGVQGKRNLVEVWAVLGVLFERPS